VFLACWEKKMQITDIRLTRRTFIAASALLAGSIGFSQLGLVSPAFAATSAEVQAQADEVSAQLEELQAQLNEASDNYYEALGEYDAAVAAMDEAQSRIDAAEATISATQDKLSDRAVSMYKNGAVSYLDVLLGSTSFSDFTNTWDMLNQLNDEDASLVEQLDAAEAEAQAAHDDYARQAQLAQEKLDEAASIRDQAELLTEQYQAKLDGLNSEVQELLDAEEAAAKQEAEDNAPTTPDPDDDSSTGDIIAEAEKHMGAAYVWGAAGPDVFDCSGFVWYCLYHTGHQVSRTSAAGFYGECTKISESEARAGDLVFFTGTYGEDPNAITHIGIYGGDGMMIHTGGSPGVQWSSVYNVGTSGPHFGRLD
jgi:peptidoglycan DL-endopeptidase CwlO